ncbi:hypothetical protein NQ176_g4676 [Zarea fungicola]|uniref:Uncharacterized protein n=1 Tax=Zarea fungicola TaxID=93591 RepID=A0ACC1ND56_9HYPO|nr:hypothetical protein NQ176_g4676 [Lecanicillium fungicola]
MAAFHLFPKLPAEVRAMIWANSIEPRTVDVRSFQGSRGPRRGAWSWGPPDPYTPVAVPGIMHACRESRRQGLYEKVAYTHPAPPGQRYAWINFDMDMIDLGVAFLENVKHIAPRIRRLKFERSNVSEYWYYEEADNLTWFDNVELYHVVVPDALNGWYAAWEECYWACKKENLIYIDKQTGQMLNAVELREVEDAEIAKAEREWEIEEDRRRQVNN